MYVTPMKKRLMPLFLKLMQYIIQHLETKQCMVYKNNEHKILFYYFSLTLSINKTE